MFKTPTLLASVLSTFLLALAAIAGPPTGTLILEDSFERTEADPAKEQVGNEWGTNSKARAQGVKQVDLKDGAMHITRAKVADHGVSVTHEAAFKDATIQLRFKIGKGDTLGINIADMKEKEVHAGHICLAQIKPTKLEIADLKTGRMSLDVRTRRKAGKDTEADKKLMKTKSKYFPVKLDVDQWHELQVQIAGEKMTVTIDGEKAGEFSSEGIGHATKSRLRLAVAKSAWVDDVKIYKQ